MRLPEDQVLYLDQAIKIKSRKIYDAEFKSSPVLNSLMQAEAYFLLGIDRSKVIHVYYDPKEACTVYYWETTDLLKPEEGKNENK